MGEVSAGDGSRSPSLSSIALPLIVFSERLGLNCRCNDPLSVFFWLSPAVVSVDVNFAICVNHYGNCIELCTLSLSNSPVTVRCFAVCTHRRVCFSTENQDVEVCSSSVHAADCFVCTCAGAE